MMAELPGILVRLVDGLRRFEQHGGRYHDDDAARTDATWFARQSDPVQLFLAEATATGGWTKRGDLYRSFEEWAKDRHRTPMTRKPFYDAIVAAGFPTVAVHGQYGFKLRLVGDWDDAVTSPSLDDKD